MSVKPRDDLSDRFKNVSDTIKTTITDTQKKYDQSSVGKFHADMNAWAKFWNRLSRVAAWTYATFIWPITWRFWRGAKKVATWYRDFFLWATTAKDKYGTPYFSKKRGLAVSLGMFFGTGFMLMTLWAGLIGVFWYWPLVQHDEKLYLYNSQKISDGLDLSSTLDDIHEVHGCETLPCNDQSSVTFRVRASVFNEYWSILHNGTLFYPGYVAGAVAPVMEECTITSYGIRKKFKAIIRSWDIYPDLVKVTSCAPVDEKAPILKNKDYR